MYKPAYGETNTFDVLKFTLHYLIPTNHSGRNQHIWCIEIQRWDTCYPRPFQRNQHIWCIEIEILTSQSIEKEMRNQHIWCIEILNTFWTNVSISRETNTFDVLKYNKSTFIVYSNIWETNTFDVLKWWWRYVFRIYMAWETNTFDVLKLKE